MLTKLLNENEFVTVFFCKYWPMCHISDLMLLVIIKREWLRLRLYFVTDENDVPESAEVLSRLEKIDDETNSMDITFVKMADARYARKWGVTKLPAIVYFRNKFPSVYRGNWTKIIKNQNGHWLLTHY